MKLVWQQQLLPQIFKVKLSQECLEIKTLLLELTEELLGVRPRLSAASRTDMLLDLMPLLAEQFQGFQEFKMLGASPAPIFLRDNRQSFVIALPALSQFSLRFHARVAHVYYNSEEFIGRAVINSVPVFTSI